MGAYRIDKDFTISRVEGSPTDIIDEHQEWDCVAYDAENDIWCNDWGLLDDALAVAWIGEARRVPLPAIILGRYGDGYGDPRLALEEVRFGEVGNSGAWLAFR